MKTKIFFISVLLITQVSSMVSQIAIERKEDGVCSLSIDSQIPLLKNAGEKFIILDKHGYTVGVMVTDSSHEIRLWNLENGNSESIYKIARKPYDDYEHDEIMPSIYGIIATHDQSKLIFYVEYSVRYNPKYEKRTWSGTLIYDNPTKTAYNLVCYSILEKRIIWETDWQTVPLRSEYNWRDMSGCNLIVSYDDKYIYFVGEKKVTVLNTDTGQPENDSLILFPKSLDLGSGYTRLIICPSRSGRYIAYFNDAYGTTIFYRGTTIHVWDDADKKLIPDLYIKGRGVRRIAFTSDEQHLLTINNDNSFRLISLQDKKIKNTWEKMNPVSSYYYDNGFYLTDGQPQYLFIDGNLSFNIWLYPQMEQVFKSGNHSRGALSRDGKTLVLSEKGYLFLIDTSDWSIKWYVPL